MSKETIRRAPEMNQSKTSSKRPRRQGSSVESATLSVPRWPNSEVAQLNSRRSTAVSAIGTCLASQSPCRMPVEVIFPKQKKRLRRASLMRLAKSVAVKDLILTCSRTTLLMDMLQVVVDVEDVEDLAVDVQNHVEVPTVDVEYHVDVVDHVEVVTVAAVDHEEVPTVDEEASVVVATVAVVDSHEVVLTVVVADVGDPEVVLTVVVVDVGDPAEVEEALIVDVADGETLKFTKTRQVEMAHKVIHPHKT